jgi:ureidoacrylate peracid hydrolase
MKLDEIDIEKTALLFFDMLNGFYHEAGDVKKARMKPMVDNAVRLMKSGRQANVPIFFAKGNHRPDDMTASNVLTDTDNALKPWPNGVIKRGLPVAVEGSSSSQVIPELDPCPTDYYIVKNRWSAFYQTFLDLALRTRGIQTIIVSGASTDIGVTATIFAGRDMDYHIIIVRDACASVYGAEVHDMLMDRVFPRMCRVRTTDEVLGMIIESSARRTAETSDRRT